MKMHNEKNINKREMTMRHCDGLEETRVVPLRVANNCRYKNHYNHRQLNRYILVDFIRQKNHWDLHLSIKFIFF